MNDSISRAAVLEVISGYCPDEPKSKDLREYWKKRFEPLIKVREEIEKIPLADRWIPCEERLPEEDGQYLITVKYKHVNDSYEDVYAEHGDWFDGRWDMFCFGHCGEVEDIIAWMPLPEPWKGDADADHD